MGQGKTMLEAAKKIIHFKSAEMVLSEGLRNGVLSGGGKFSACRLLTLENSTTLCSGVTTYDGCSIESAMRYDEVFVVLDGAVRILWGRDFGRTVEARRGDVVWLPKGSKVKYEGDKGRIFYTLYPVDWQARPEEAEPAGADVPHVRLIESRDMVYEQMFPEGGGYGSRCRLITPEMSKTVGASMHTYDGCSIEWTTHYDQATVVLEGTLRLRIGDDFSRVIEATAGDVVRLPDGTHFKYEGEKAKTFTALYPVDWVTRDKG